MWIFHLERALHPWEIPYRTKMGLQDGYGICMKRLRTTCTGCSPSQREQAGWMQLFIRQAAWLSWMDKPCC
ncbi:hypothetical protein [Paenibacillus dendrobii]|uniref:hypothetical protein n=1 Tax=Paenibacillus dendrobii TaxID=2691084 RepID=UPI00311AA29B